MQGKQGGAERYLHNRNRRPGARALVFALPCDPGLQALQLPPQWTHLHTKICQVSSFVLSSHQHARLLGSLHWLEALLVSCDIQQVPKAQLLRQGKRGWPGKGDMALSEHANKCHVLQSMASTNHTLHTWCDINSAANIEVDAGMCAGVTAAHLAHSAALLVPVLIEGEHALGSHQFNTFLCIRKGVLNSKSIMFLHSVKDLVCFGIQAASVQTARKCKHACQIPCIAWLIVDAMYCEMLTLKLEDMHACSKSGSFSTECTLALVVDRRSQNSG